MTKEDIQKLRDHCEVTKVQFKEMVGLGISYKF